MRYNSFVHWKGIHYRQIFITLGKWNLGIEWTRTNWIPHFDVWME